MFVEVNGARLFFDVEGAGLVPVGPRMRAKPTLILLHGGPGFDHAGYKPAFSALADIAQIVYLDHRGNGRSTGDDPKTWNLAQWGDAVKAFCDALGIEKPIIYRASFGGMVALAYATRHPGHPGKLILVSTEASGHSHPERRVGLFERLGGPEVGALARRRFLDAKLDPEMLEAWVRLAFPVYTRTRKDPLAAQRTIRRPEVNHCFARPGGEGRTFNFFPLLASIALLHGRRAPVCVYGFDLMEVEARDLRDQPLEVRRARLKPMLQGEALPVVVRSPFLLLPPARSGSASHPFTPMTVASTFVINFSHGATHAFAVSSSPT